MSIFGILTFILVLAVLVFFHELGHFLFAKLFRMKVEEFAIGFGNPKLRVYHDGETEYNLRAFPLGGFVRIKGMEIEDAAERRLTGAVDAPRSATPGMDAAGLAAKPSTLNSEINRSLDSIAEPHHNSGMETTNMSTLSQEVDEVSGFDPDGFNNRPIYQRFWVILGGPLFSFLFGWIVLCLIGVTFGFPDGQTTVIEQVIKNKPAARVGIVSGDRVIKINDKPVATGEAMVSAIHDSPGIPTALTIQTAKGETRTVTVTPESVDDGTGKKIGLIGVRPLPTYKRSGLGESFVFGTRYVGEWFRQMGQLFSRPKQLGESVGGPVKIFQYSNEASKQGGSSVMNLLGSLSLSLGLFNLFPIPILDGGHIALMALEKIRGRKLTVDQTNRVFTVGFIIMASLFVVILFKDLFIR